MARGATGIQRARGTIRQRRDRGGQTAAGLAVASPVTSPIPFRLSPLRPRVGSIVAMRRVLALLIVVVMSAALAGRAPRPAPRRVEIAPGVHLFMTAPYGGVGLDGNSVAVLSSDGVLVFDANGTPAAAEAVPTRYAR